jgi:hypothetical protein
VEPVPSLNFQYPIRSPELSKIPELADAFSINWRGIFLMALRPLMYKAYTYVRLKGNKKLISNWNMSEESPLRLI